MRVSYLSATKHTTPNQPTTNHTTNSKFISIYWSSCVWPLGVTTVHERTTLSQRPSHQSPPWLGTKVPPLLTFRNVSRWASRHKWLTKTRNEPQGGGAGKERWIAAVSGTLRGVELATKLAVLIGWELSVFSSLFSTGRDWRSSIRREKDCQCLGVRGLTSSLPTKHTWDCSYFLRDRSLVPLRALIMTCLVVTCRFSSLLASTRSMRCDVGGARRVFYSIPSTRHLRRRRRRRLCDRPLLHVHK